MKELESIYNSFLAGSRITTDSREVKTGDIFIALKGENHNGNTFAEKAVAQGAKHVVIDEAAYNTAPQCVLVPDTLQFLQQLAPPEIEHSHLGNHRDKRQNHHERIMSRRSFQKI